MVHSKFDYIRIPAIFAASLGLCFQGCTDTPSSTEEEEEIIPIPTEPVHVVEEEKVQVQLNEVSALNLSWLDQDGDDPAWVEIYNMLDKEVNLKGFALVENLENPRKWVFHDETIGPKSYRTVFLDKKDIHTVKEMADGIDDEGNTLHARTHTNWKINKDGGTIYIIDNHNAIHDSITYPALPASISFGRTADGSYKYFANPTPEAANDDANAYAQLAPTVDFSTTPSGFYAEPFTLNPPTVAEGATVRCMDNGSKPTEDSPAFTEPMEISKNTVLRCATFVPGALTTEVSTNTYFIEETVNMPVVAVTVDSAFFREYYIKTDAETPKTAPEGLYEDKEYPVHVEYFEKGSSSKKSSWNIEAGISIMGGYSRLKNKKSVAIVMREQYQDGKLEYPLFETRKETNSKFRGFNLRNNGNRFVSDYIGDAVGGAILEGSGVDYQRSRQVVVFYNGRYYGIHDMRERFNKHYVETNYGIDANTVTMVKHLGHEVTASNGSVDEYKSLLSFVANNDFSGAGNANYEMVKTMMDVGNFADYMAAEAYDHNGDWPNNNVRAWKSPNQPWKFMVYDLDHGFDWTWGVNGGEFGQTTEIFPWILKGGGNKPCPDEGCFANLFIQLIKNPDFERLFLNRSAIMLQNNLNAANTAKVVNAMTATIDTAEIARDLKKFKQDDMYYKNSCGHGFSKTGSCLKEWTESRDTTILYDYANQFGVDTTLITVKIAADGLGQVQVEGKTVPQTYSGKFFAGVAMELYAVPTGGGIFYQWEDGSTDNPRLVAPTDGASYTASFK